jgi:DNA-binding NtrC family response regulator
VNGSPTPQPEREVGAAAQGDERATRGTILVVEDEDFVREVTCEVLEFEGFRVMRARSAAEASRLFRQCRNGVQLLITDVVLPGRNGCRLASDLVAFSPALKIVFMSGYPENEVTKLDLNTEGVFYLAKPFSVQALMRIVKHALKNGEGVPVGKANGQKAANQPASNP